MPTIVCMDQVCAYDRCRCMSSRTITDLRRRANFRHRLHCAQASSTLVIVWARTPDGAQTCHADLVLAHLAPFPGGSNAFPALPPDAPSLRGAGAGARALRLALVALGAMEQIDLEGLLGPLDEAAPDESDSLPAGPEQSQPLGGTTGLAHGVPLALRASPVMPAEHIDIPHMPLAEAPRARPMFRQRDLAHAAHARAAKALKAATKKAQRATDAAATANSALNTVAALLPGATALLGRSGKSAANLRRKEVSPNNFIVLTRATHLPANAQGGKVNVGVKLRRLICFSSRLVIRRQKTSLRLTSWPAAGGA